MYNRYVPQPDGSYQRHRVAERRPPSSPPRAATQCEEIPVPPSPPPPSEPKTRPYRQHHRPVQMPRKEDSISGFLSRLLPKDFDTGDLLIAVLLLLMAGECADDQNSALLTLFLYFFM